MTQVRQRPPKRPRCGVMRAPPAARAAPAGTVYPQPFQYRARPLQAALHGDPARFKVVVAHRRFGKTVFAILQLVLAAIDANRLPAARYAYLAPFHRQAKAVVWDYLKD